MRSRVSLVVMVVALVAASCGSAAHQAVSQPADQQQFALPHITHVWNIMLENEDFGDTFGHPASDPYLAKTLPAEGALLEQYYGVGHNSLDNYIAYISGQPPNPATQADCKVFTDFRGTVSDGLAQGDGCVYPVSVPTIANQLTARGLTWKAYEQDMGNIPSRESATCGHPSVGATDGTQVAVPGDGYAARHDPFVYFHGIIDAPSYCDQHVVPLGSISGSMPAGTPAGVTGLAADLGAGAQTPAYSFITPDLCFDGHDYPCLNTRAGSSAAANIDQFLQAWIPVIQASAAYRDGGLIEITFDESESDASACCGESGGSPPPGLVGPGGGRVGAVLLSPSIKPNTVSKVKYNHYSTLATDEKLFGLPLLGEGRSVTSTFGADVFTAAPQA